MSVQQIGEQIIILDAVDSSNNYAMGQVHERKTRHGDLFFALEQTAGKGQHGRRWLSKKGENIMASIVLDTSPLSPEALFPLNMAMALGARDFLEEHTNGDTTLKWPNDLYWRDRKAGGILIENNWAGQNWQFAIVGIGINLNQVEFEPMAKKAVSLKQITGKQFDPIESVRQLAVKLEARWQELLAGRNAELLQAYNEVLYCRNQWVRLKVQEELIDTRIKAVNLKGELVTENDGERIFQHGTVEWV